MNRILFLNENPIPSPYHSGVISGKELRLPAALSEINEVHVLAPKGPGVSSASGTRNLIERKIYVHHLPPCPYYFRALPLFFFGFIFTAKLKPITIEAESPIISGFAAVLLGKLTGTKIIIHVRASYQELLRIHLHIIPIIIKKLVLNLVTGFVFHCHPQFITNSNLYARDLKLKGVISTVINPGVQYPPSWQSQPAVPPIIGFIGRLVPEKGVPVLLDAIRLLTLRPGLSWRVEIVGTGPELPHLIKLTQKFKLNDRILFRGFQPNFSALKKWYCVVNPNLVKHPLEMVNAEAAYVGIPVITFGDTWYPETVIDQQTGFKLNSVSSQTLADKIEALLKSPALRNKLGRNARIFAKNNYSFDTQVQKLALLYRDLKIM